MTLTPRTRAQLAAALDAKGVPAAASAAVLDRFSEVGLIDDAAFARAWVVSRHTGRGLAGRALSQELRQRGVDPAIIAEAVDELDPQTERATAAALVRRKLAGMERLAPQVQVRRLVGLLARKGYSPGLAYAVVRAELARGAIVADELCHDQD